MIGGKGLMIKGPWFAFPAARVNVAPVRFGISPALLTARDEYVGQPSLGLHGIMGGSKRNLHSPEGYKMASGSGGSSIVTRVLLDSFSNQLGVARSAKNTFVALLKDGGVSPQDRADKFIEAYNLYGDIVRSADALISEMDSVLMPMGWAEEIEVFGELQTLLQHARDNLNHITIPEWDIYELESQMFNAIGRNHFMQGNIEESLRNGLKAARAISNAAVGIKGVVPGKSAEWHNASIGLVTNIFRLVQENPSLFDTALKVVRETDVETMAATELSLLAALLDRETRGHSERGEQAQEAATAGEAADSYLSYLRKLSAFLGSDSANETTSAMYDRAIHLYQLSASVWKDLGEFKKTALVYAKIYWLAVKMVSSAEEAGNAELAQAHWENAVTCHQSIRQALTVDGSWEIIEEAVATIPFAIESSNGKVFAADIFVRFYYFIVSHLQTLAEYFASRGNPELEKQFRELNEKVRAFEEWTGQAEWRITQEETTKMFDASQWRDAGDGFMSHDLHGAGNIKVGEIKIPQAAFLERFGISVSDYLISLSRQVN